MDIKKITKLIGCNEAYKTSNEIMSQIMDPDKRALLFNRFLEVESDLSFDWFTEFFQEVLSDRKDKKQDYTPESLVALANQLIGESQSHTDLCAGSGGLTIGKWDNYPSQRYVLEECSDAVLPFLLFNLSIRNMNAIVKHGDSLQQDFKAVYKLTSGNTFSDVEIVQDSIDTLSDSVIINPPFSMAWQRDDIMINDSRFSSYGLAPKSKSDYAFLLTGLDKLTNDGQMVAIMGQGILFRGGAEGKIRQALLEGNHIETVIICPSDMFLKTAVSVVILILSKQRQSSDVLFVDASNQYAKQGKFNVMTSSHISNIVGAINNREDVDKYAHVASFDNIKENDFNLNIPCYVDTFIPESCVNLYENAKAIQQINQAMTEAQLELKDMMSHLVTTNPNSQLFLNEVTNTNGY